MFRSILLGAVLALAAVACSSVRTSNSSGVDTPEPEYFAVAPFYRIQGGQLEAQDASGQWFFCLQPQHDVGDVNGSDAGTGEEWVKVGGSVNDIYYRVAPYNQHRAPVFAHY